MDAERQACEWMRRNGFKHARLTGVGSRRWNRCDRKKAVAQVTFHARPVGVSEMQRMSGIAASRGTKALFFSNAGYTRPALAWARAHQIENFTVVPIRRIKYSPTRRNAALRARDRLRLRHRP